MDQLCIENPKDQQSQLTSEIKKWERTIMSWNQDFLNYPATRANWNFKHALIDYLAGDFHKALTYLNFAIKLNPEYSDCYFYKGMVLASLNREEESLECWNYLLQNNAEFSFLNLIKAETLQKLQNNPESIELYDKFIQNKPERIFASSLKIGSLTDEGRYRDLKEISEKMINLNPKFGEAYTYKGWAYEGLDDHAQALEWYYSAVENDRDEFMAYKEIGKYLSHQNKYQEALDNFNISISINPYYKPSSLEKARCLSKLGKKMNSISNIESLLFKH